MCYLGSLQEKNITVPNNDLFINESCIMTTDGIFKGVAFGTRCLAEGQMVLDLLDQSMVLSFQAYDSLFDASWLHFFVVVVIFLFLW